MREVVDLIEQENADLRDASQFTEAVVKSLDRDGDGAVSR